MESSLFLFDLRTGHERGNRNCLEINSAIFRLMGSGEHRERCLIVPMNLPASPLVAVACSVTVVDSGALVPVGKIGSDTRQSNCLVTPLGEFPLGRFAFSVRCVGRVGGGPKLVSHTPPDPTGEGLCCLVPARTNQPFAKSPMFSALFANDGSWEGNTSKILT